MPQHLDLNSTGAEPTVEAWLDIINGLLLVSGHFLRRVF
jgi:hypothetical protein